MGVLSDGLILMFNATLLWLQIVPEAVRTSVYAFDKSIVMALGAISTPLSGLLAEKVFGATTLSVHKPSQRGGGHAHAPAPAVAQEHANNLTNAHALENGLLTTLLIPLVLKFIIYTFLYCRFQSSQRLPCLISELSSDRPVVWGMPHLLSCIRLSVFNCAPDDNV